MKRAELAVLYAAASPAVAAASNDFVVVQDRGSRNTQRSGRVRSSKKMDSALAIIAGGRPVKQVCDVLGVARSNVSAKRARVADWQGGRGAVWQDATERVEEIQHAVTDLPSYGYRRVWGVIRGEREVRGAAPVNVKRIYRVMRVHGVGLILYAEEKMAWISRSSEYKLGIDARMWV